MVDEVAEPSITEREKSHLSTVSTSVAENDTLRTRSRSPAIDGSIHLSPSHPSEHLPSPQLTVDELKPEPDFHPVPELPAAEPAVEPTVEPTVEPIVEPEQEPDHEMEVEQMRESVPEPEVALESEHEGEQEPQPEPEPEQEPEGVPGQPEEEETEMKVDKVHPEHQDDLGSIAATTSSSSLSQQTVESITVPEHPQEVPSEVPMVVDDEPPPPPEEEGKDNPQPDPPQEEEEEEEEDSGPPMIIIIEELDTPATRREKNMRRKAERAAAKAAALAKAQAATRSESLPGPSQSGGAKWDTISELSSLSGLSDDEGREEPAKVPIIVVEPKPAISPAVIALKSGEMIPEGTLGE